MKQEILLGQTDYTALVFIPDSTSTVGKGKTGLVAANLTVSYSRVETDNDVTVTDVTSSLNNLANLTATHNDWGLLEVSATLAAGLYRIDFADAVFASGAWSAVVYVCVTTGLAAASPMEFVLKGFDPFAAVVPANVTQLLGTAWLTPGTAGTPDVNAKLVGGQTASAAGTVTFPGTVASTTNITAGTITTVTNLTNAPTAGDLTATMKTSVTTAATAATPIAASVTGAVGSVTGLTASDVGAIKVKTDNLPAAPASTTNITAGTITTVTNLTNAATAGDLTATMKTSVNAEVLDVINVDTYAEPAQGAPGATISLAAKIGFLYKFLRNKVTQDATTLKVYDDAGSTVDQKATVSDSGTLYTRGEIGTGP